jgi:hypothetical protein
MQTPTAPCSLLTTNEVGTALGIPISSANPQTDNPKYTICTYNDPYAEPPSPEPLVIVQINTRSVTPAALQQSFTTANLVFETVSDTGDAAFYTKTKEKADGTLFVIRNNYLFSIAIIDSPQDQATTRQTLQVLAQTALGRWSK